MPALPPFAQPAAVAVFAPGPGALSFGGAMLGMSKADWLQLVPGGVTAGRAAATCAPAPDATVSCTYATRYGQETLPQAIPLSGGYLAREPTYVFVSDRLRRIEFRTSLNAFNALDARFTQRFGPPSLTLRQTLPAHSGPKLNRVVRAWRAPGGVVRIIDPSTARLDSLSVVYTDLGDR